MKPRVATERRVERRVQARLQIELQFDPGGKSHPTNTINISSNGVYFASPTFVEPLTRLSMRLLLPGNGGDAPETAVECVGVVVRCVPEAPSPQVDRYEIACYFTDTSDEFRTLLEAYVQSNL